MRILRPGIILLWVVASAMVAHADSISVSTAATWGCFDTASCTPVSTTDSVDAISGSFHTGTLTFNGSSDTTPLLIPGGSDSTFLLGSFTLTDDGTGPAGGSAGSISSTFTALINFTLPTITAGGTTNPNTYDASVTGTVTKHTNGDATIDFNNSPFSFNFNDGSYFGSFSLTLSDLTITLPNVAGPDTNTVNWYGTLNLTSATAVTNGPPTSVPEPATLSLLGGGLLAIATALRRRVRK